LALALPNFNDDANKREFRSIIAFLSRLVSTENSPVKTGPAQEMQAGWGWVKFNVARLLSVLTVEHDVTQWGISIN
jgi:hypothetical protein